MPARDVLHDVPLNLLVLEHRHPVVDQDGWLGRLEVGPGHDQNVIPQPLMNVLISEVKQIKLTQ